MTAKRRADIQKVKSLLDARPHKAFRGLGTDLADALDMSYQDFRIVLDTVRRKDWMDEQGWTIPYVGQGGRLRQVYAIVDTTQSAKTFLRHGQNIRGHDMLQVMRNWDQQCDFGISRIPSTTPEGAWMNLAAVQVKAMIAMAVALGL